MSKIKVLGIAPYEGMKHLMIQAASGLKEIELTVFVGDLEQGAAIVQKYKDEDFDIIISRGGTADLIRQKTNILVIDIDLSVYDILRSIRLARTSNQQFSIVGFPVITDKASFLCNVLGYQIDLYTIHNEEEARITLQKLANEGCSLILCDVITNTLAREYGIQSILILSGPESVESAMAQAVNISRIFSPLKARNALLHHILRKSTRKTLILNHAGEVVYSTLFRPLPAAAERKIKNYLSSVIFCGPKRFTVSADENMLMISGQSISFNGESLALFEIQETAALPTASEKNGILYLDKEEAEDEFFNSFYGITRPNTAALYEHYAQSRTPVIISGEMGTGQKQMARLLYSKGCFQNAPLCVIDCALLRQKGMSYLMDHENSPLSEKDMTVHFYNIDMLEENEFSQLFLTLRDVHFQSRNRLLFTCISNPNGSLPPRFQNLLNWFGCLTLHLPPLRSHKQDIPQLASLYISALNMRNAKEIVGIEPEGMNALQSYDWPANYSQFKRVLNELVFLTDTPHIQFCNIKKLICQEEAAVRLPKEDHLENVLKNKTLEEIEMMAVQYALHQKNGNQSAAAAQLGISRTTLWRMLRKIEK